MTDSDPGAETDWPEIGARIAEEWAHGHDDHLVDECTLCQGEFAAAMAAARERPSAEPDPFDPADIAHLLDWDCEPDWPPPRDTHDLPDISEWNKQ